MNVIPDKCLKMSCTWWYTKKDNMYMNDEQHVRILQSQMLRGCTANTEFSF
jgi:hypothetical protein